MQELLDACPVKVIRAFYRKAWRYMDAYRFFIIQFELDWLYTDMRSRKGLNSKQTEYAVKKYRSHRRIGAGIMMDLYIISHMN